MMMKRTFTGFITLLFAFLLASPMFAQQIYPVKVSGNLVPPNSLILSDYTFSRADDISFMITLNDPDPATIRKVRFRISILHEGVEILTTNPNYLPLPIDLQAQVPQIFNGADLAGYLNAANLVSVNGNGQPGDLLPAGYNSICIEVIDVLRNEPISQRFCANGYFELAQPPLLNLPVCNALLPFPTTPNLTFSWMPMHLLSANRPMDVSYEFTLVKLFPGVTDPNDGFNFSTIILQKTVNQPILQYLEDNPPLEQNGLYAWRVRAMDGRGYDLFQNHGYSQICSFAFENGGQLGSALFACEGGDCSYSQSISSTPLNTPLAANDKVAVGFFDMNLTSVATNTQGGYSGTGTIYIPYLFSKLRVTFDNIQVNKDKRMFAGQVNAVVQDPTLIPPLFSEDNQSSLAGAAGSVATGFADEVAQGLTDYFNSNGASGPPNLVSTLKNVAEANAIPIGLPIGIDQQVPGTSVRTTVAVTGISFTPRQAMLNAVLAAQMGDNGAWVKFGAKGLCFQPRGLSASAPTLSLLNDVPLNSMGIPLTIKGMAPNGDPGTYLSWNCEGFDQFVLKGQYDFSRDYLRPKDDPAGQVSATFTVTTRRLNDFMVKVDALGDFFVKGAEDFPFHVGDVWFDFSKTQNPPGLLFPDNYPAGSADVNFRGVYITQAGVTLPPVFQHSSTGALPNLTGSNLLFDQNGMTGHVFGKNLINLASGDLGGWGYSLDSAWLNITANSFVNSGFKGKMRLPIMRDEESLKYTGFFQPGVNASGLPTGLMDFGFKAAPDVVTIDLLRARIEFDSTSEITVGRTNGQFDSPKANLSGLLTAAAPEGDPGFAGKIMQEIQSLQDALSSAGLGSLVPKLNIDGIRFNDMKIDLAAADKFQIGSIVPQNASFQFLGMNADLSTLDFTKLSAADVTQLNMPSLSGVIPRSLKFKLDLARDLLGALAPSVIFNLVIKEEQVAGKTKFSFGGFDLQFIAPDVAFDCGANIAPIALDASPSNFASAPIQGDLKVGHFILKPAYPLTSDNGTGLISGQGTVDVDILGPFRTLNVVFTDVQVDKTGRIVSGEVITGGDAGLFNAPNLSGVMSNVQSQVDAMVGGMNKFNLPVVLGKKANGENERDQGLILMGLVFGPDKASARAKVVFDPGNGHYLEFVADGLTLVPNGIANFDLAVGLANDFEFQPIDGMNPLVFKKYNPADSSGSFIRMDCKGFLEFNLEASYSFSKDMLVSLDHPDDPVTGTFIFNTTKWGEFMARMQGIGSFTFPGLDGFTMSVSDAWVDFSKDRNVNGIQFPENYDDGGIPSEPFRWRGFYLPKLSITLPPEFALSSTGRAPTLTCENMLIDKQGMSFSLFGNNLVDGEAGGWGFALDSVGITVVTNSLKHGGLAGRINMPLMDDPMQYLGSLEKDPDGFWALKLHPAQTTRFNISALKSYINLEPASEITLGTVPDPLHPGKRIFKPYANLYGKIGVDIKKEDFTASGDNLIGDAIDAVEGILGAEFTFVPPAINLYGLKINHPDLPAGKKFGLDAYDIEGSISIAGHELSLDNLEVLDQRVNIKNKMYDGLGIQFSVSVPLITLKVGLWAKLDTVNGKSKYAFGKVDLETIVPTFQCAGNCGPAPANQTVVNTNPAVGSKIKVGGFNIDVTEPGKGRVRIGFLNSTLNVEFANIGVNSAGELVSGQLTTVANQNMLSTESVSVGAGGQSIKLPLMDKLVSGVSGFTSLPFSIKDKIQKLAGNDVNLPFDFIIVGLRFTPTGTRLDAALMFETGDASNPYIKFGATGLCFTPDGVNLDQIRLFLAEPITLQDWGMPITIVKGDPNNNTGSFALFSCDGVKQFQLQAKYTFGTDVFIPVQQGKTAVDATFTINSQKWGQFIASATIDSFQVAGLDDVIFKITDASVDCDDTQNPAFSASVGNTRPPSWRGFYMKQVMVALPASFSKNGGRIVLSGNDFIYNRSEGISGLLMANGPLINIGEGRLNSWAFSLDTVALSLNHSSVDMFKMTGGIHVPVTSEGNNIGYKALLGRDAQNNLSLLFTLSVGGTYNIPFLGSNTNMVLTPSSVVGIKTVLTGSKKSFEPYCDLTGALNIGIAEGTIGSLSYPKFDFKLMGFENFTLNDATSTIPSANGGLQKLNFKAFTFAGLSYPVGTPPAAPGAATPPPTPSGGAGAETPNQAVGGFPLNVRNINFGDYQSPGGESLKRLTLTINLNFTSTSGNGGGLAASTTLGVLAKLNLSALPSQPWNAVQFKGLDVDKITIDANMGPIALKGGLVFIKNDSIYGNGLKGGLEMTLEPKLKVTVIAQFGSTTYGSFDGQKYRYWFADAKAIFAPGIGYAGVGLYGIGGGAYYNMTQKLNNAVLSGNTNKVALTMPASGATSTPPSPDELSTQSNMFTPGVSLSGVTYVPYKPNAGSIIGVMASVVIGSHPDPSAFNCDLTLAFQINTQGGLERISLSGKAYLMAPILNRDQAKAWAAFSCTLDNTNKTLSADLEGYINVTGQVVGAYTGGPQYKAGEAHFFSSFGSSPTWYLTIGTPRNKVKINVVAVNQTFGGYFMVGNLSHPNIINETAMPPMSAYFDGRLTLLTDRRTRSANAISLGSGIAFGAEFMTPAVEKQILVFYVNYQAGLAFDITMTRPTGTCNADGSPVGINGWYLQGQVLAFFDAGVGIQVNINLLFKRIRGRFSIADVHIEAGIQAQLPNPTWFAGQLAGRYRILGGLVKGSFKFSVEVGDYCVLGPPVSLDPLAGIELVSSMKPTEGQTNVAVYTKEALGVVFNMPLNEAFTVETEDGKETYRPILVNAGVYRGTAGIAGKYIFSTDGVKNAEYTTFTNTGKYNELKFNPESILSENSTYTAKITVAFEKLDGSTWKKVNNSDKEYTRSFKTGPRPDKIVSDILEYQAPGFRQRNWYNGYADPLIEFTKKGFGYFFNPKIEVTINGQKQCVEHNFYLRLVNVKTGESKLLPLSALPGPEYETQLSLLMQQFQNLINQIFASLFSMFHIPPPPPPPPRCTQPTYAETKSNIKNIPAGNGITIGMNSLSDASLFAKNTIYEIQIVAIPITADLNNTSTLTFGSQTNTYNVGATLQDSNFIEQTTKTVTGELAIGGSPIKILYAYHFKTSAYNNLQEKIQALTADGAQSMTNSGSAGYAYVGSGLSNNQTLLKLKGNEVFDQYDQYRLTRNVGNMLTTGTNGQTLPYYQDYNTMFPKDWLRGTWSTYYIFWMNINYESSWYSAYDSRYYSRSAIDAMLSTPTSYGPAFELFFNPSSDLSLTEEETTSGDPKTTEIHHTGVLLKLDQAAQQQMYLQKSFVNTTNLNSSHLRWPTTDGYNQFRAIGNIMGYSPHYFIRGDEGFGYYPWPIRTLGLLAGSTYQDYVVYRGNPTYQTVDNTFTFWGITFHYTTNNLTSLPIQYGLKKVEKYTDSFRFPFYYKNTWSRIDEVYRNGYFIFALPR